MISHSSSKPKFPFIEGPRDYQKSAYVNWCNSNKKGIFAMATGTGKTVTSLYCLLNEYNTLNFYQAVIIVPTITLIDQWKKECRNFNFNRIITVSSKSTWLSDLYDLVSTLKYVDTSYIIIVTYASFSNNKFFELFLNLPRNTLLIADEVHNIGAKTVSKKMKEVHLENRIGLSATPERQFDEEGNLVIHSFFSDNYPYCYNFSMSKALDLGFLCDYKYYPHIVELSEQEFELYEKLTKDLAKFFDPDNLTYKQSEIVKKLLLKRKRIIHKAVGKLDKFKDIIKDEFEKRGNNLQYTLIYSPEGVTPIYNLLDYSFEGLSDCSMISQFTREVRNLSKKITVSQYTSKTKNREEILRKFEEGRISVLTSMKCLDEGVDIPRAELAIFCSSSGNPRQFIQRRGRVLRTHKEKSISIIHDLIVVPIVDQDLSNYEVEKRLVRKELKRVINFSKLALNKTYAFKKLESVLDYYSLSLYD